MGGKQGCSIARCAGGAYDKSIINKVMLRFRPIAPKPTVGGSSPGGSTMDNNGRAKSKYVRVSSRKRGKRKKIRNQDKRKDDEMDKKVETLQLLPVKGDWKDSPAEGGSWCNLDRTLTTKPVVHHQDLPIWFNFNFNTNNNSHHPMVTTAFSVSDRGSVVPARRVVESWVTVECVTDTDIDGLGLGLGSTDEGRRKNLEVDTCPGFISDGLNRVQWVNDAYRKMVCQNDDEDDDDDDQKEATPAEMVVYLVVKEKLSYMDPAFACRVRLQYTWHHEKCSRMVPCDAWSMDVGGFAWRLDVKAALSLGR